VVDTRTQIEYIKYMGIQWATYIQFWLGVATIIECKSLILLSLFPYAKKREMKSPNGEVFTTVTEFADGTQDTRWYDWRLQNWDTKWDAGDVNIEEQTWEDELESFQATFNTAWSPPEAVCCRLRDLFPNVSISWFYDEPGCQFAGYL